jgi:hypothetical protein
MGLFILLNGLRHALRDVPHGSLGAHHDQVTRVKHVSGGSAVVSAVAIASMSRELMKGHARQAKHSRYFTECLVSRRRHDLHSVVDQD